MVNNPERSNNSEQPSNNEWDSLNHFAGEMNINGATGKKRTFTAFDIYPRLKGESKEEYGARLKDIHEKTAKVQAEYEQRKAKEHYQNSEQGQREAEITAEFDRLSDKLDQAVKDGRMSAEHAERLKELQLDRSVNEIAGVQQDYQDRQTVGDPEKEAEYRAWLESKEDENASNLEGRQFTVIDDEYNKVKDDKVPEVVDETDDTNKTSKSSEQIPGDTPLLPGPVKAEIGEINIKSIEQEFAEDKSERLKEVQERLDKLMPEMAELYARNRRLIVGAENRTNFRKARGEYSKLLDEFLKLKAEGTFEKGKHEIAENIERRVEELRAQIEADLTEFAGGDLQYSEKSQEEIDAKKDELTKQAEETLRQEYGDWINDLKTKVNCEFVADFIKEEAELEKATVDKLDNGSLCRKFVNKVINNKALKGVLIGAAVAGLAVTGVGLVATGATIGLSFTAGGVAAGALKGGLSGFLMSRQNSKNSAVRNFASDEEVVRQLQEIDISKQDADAKNVTDWLMKQYGDASRKDRQSNVKKTAISAGIGAALGGLTSGIHINNVVRTEQSFQQQTGNTPIRTEYNVDANIGQVNQPQGTGLYETMRQMGVPKENWDKALKIAYDIEPNYGLSPGSNGVVPGFNGTIGRLAEAYPGPINTWPDTARAFITETAEEWARQGLMPSEVITTGGEPVYSTVTNVVTNYVPNAFLNFLTRATGVVGAGAIGRAVAGGEVVNETTNRGETQTTRSANTSATTSETAETEPTLDTALIDELARRYDAQSGNTEPATTSSETTTTDTEPTATTPESAEAEPALDTALIDELARQYNEQANNAEPTATAPENTGNNQTLDTDLVNSLADQYDADTMDYQIPDALRDALGEEGLAILSSRERLDTNADDQRFANLWGALSDDERQAVRSLLFEEHPDSENGQALRQWLELTGNANQE